MLLKVYICGGHFEKDDYVVLNFVNYKTWYDTLEC